MITDDELRDILRKACGTNQTAWAERYGLHRQNVNDMMCGVRPISAEVARKLGYEYKWVKVKK